MSGINQAQALVAIDSKLHRGLILGLNYLWVGLSWFLEAVMVRMEEQQVEYSTRSYTAHGHRLRLVMLSRSEAKYLGDSLLRISSFAIPSLAKAWDSMTSYHRV